MDLQEYEYREEAQAGALMDIVLVVIVIGVAAMIGVSIMSATYTQTAANLSALPAAVQTDANAAAAGTFTTLETTVVNSNTVVIALMGAIAIGAILGFLAFGRRGGGSVGSTM